MNIKYIYKKVIILIIITTTICFCIGCNSKKTSQNELLTEPSTTPQKTSILETSVPTDTSKIISEKFKKEYPNYDIIQIKTNNNLTSEKSIEGVIAYFDSKNNNRSNIAIYVKENFYLLNLSNNDLNYYFKGINPIKSINDNSISVNLYSKLEKKNIKFRIVANQENDDISFSVVN